jgi:hypothetical protein
MKTKQIRYCSGKDHLGVYREILPVFDIDGDLYLD